MNVERRCGRGRARRPALVLLLPIVVLPLLMCGQSSVITPVLSPVARQSGAGGTGGGPGGGPGSVKWSTCSTGDCQIYERVQTAPLPAASSATVNASCNTDERMLSGGFAIEHPQSDMLIMASYPSDTTTWTVSAENISTTATTLDAVVNCVHVDAATAQMNLPTPVQATVPLGTSAPVSVACPAGLVPTGGGFQVALASSAHAGPARTAAGGWLAAPLSGIFNAYMVTSQPQAGGWQVAVYAQNAPASELAYVVCWNAHGWSTIADNETAPASGSYTAEANFYNCPANTTLVGGGFTATDATGGIERFETSGDNIAGSVLGGWHVAALNTDAGAAHGVSAIGVCAV